MRRAWRCECGGALTWTPLPAPDPHALPGDHGAWRYAGSLPPVPPEHRITLGETTTPLLRHPTLGVAHKLEFMAHTGSFKDRGACVLAGWLRATGFGRVVLDSSGNAGAAMAAYLAAAGMEGTVFVPGRASPAKLAQIAGYGATLEVIDGARAVASRRAQEWAERTGGHYASHLWSPVFVAGMRTFAFELWEQLGRSAPAQIVLPVGSGSLLLGVHQGFEALRRSGLVARAPRVFGVQAARCAPLAEAFARNASTVDEELGHQGVSRSVAEGILIAQPPRAAEILAAVRASGGALVSVDEDSICAAWESLARRGLLVEPTAAVAEAGLLQLLEAGAIAADSSTVVALTGSGLKTLAAERAVAR